MFGIRSIVRHANGPPWAVAMPRPWIGLLVGLLATGHAATLALSAPALAGWIVFDVVLAWLMFRAAARPRPWRLAALGMAAAVDAAWSIQHVAHAGLGSSLPTAALRTVAVAGPIIGTIGLAWASRLAHVVADRRIRGTAGCRRPRAHRRAAACRLSSSAEIGLGLSRTLAPRHDVVVIDHAQIVDRFANLDVRSWSATAIPTSWNRPALPPRLPDCRHRRREINVLALIARRLGSRRRSA
jgi:hypothetical protein